MPRDHLSTTYSSRIKQFEAAIVQYTRQINYISLARFISLVALVWFLVLGLQDKGLVFYVFAILSLPLFLFLVNLHNKQHVHRDLLRQFRLLNEKETRCLAYDFHSLPEGASHASHAHPWSHDLDLFGKGSLFQYLNRSATLKGDQVLAQWLTEEPENIQAITTRQGIIDDLKEEIEFRQHFTAQGNMIKEKKEDHEDILKWLSSPAYIQKYRWLFYLALFMSALTLTVLVAGFFNHSNFWFLLFILTINFTILSPFLMRTNRYQAVISRKHELLAGYAELLKIITSAKLDHPILQKNREQAFEGMKEIKRLSRLLNIFDQRLNMLLGAIFNGLFLFDFIMLRLLENWKQRNQEEILKWIELIGWSDAMISLAGFAYNHPEFTVPIFTEDEAEFEMKSLGHPLIAEQKRVVNDLHITGEKVVVITGANMAGKSTYLRSLGVNMVLAFLGCPVCASSFKSGFMGLFSSMRTADSLKDEESYFLAEIKKLQLIVQRMEQGKPLLILLDEVLKGTNTTDKKRGSVGLIKRSLNYPIRCFIATHDLSLGALEKEHQGQVVNYCFESYINGMELTFDYTMRKGIATNMNASFLMKQMGIMD